MKENSIENLQNKKYFNNIDEAIKVYEELRRFKNDGFIESIDTDFFFNSTDIILSDYKRVLEINEVLLKENERLKKQVEYDKTHIYTPQTIKLNYILIQKVKDEIEKEIKYHEKNILDIENKIMLKNKTAKEEAEIEFNKYAIVVLKKMLQELLEGRK